MNTVILMVVIGILLIAFIVSAYFVSRNYAFRKIAEGKLIETNENYRKLNDELKNTNVRLTGDLFVERTALSKAKMQIGNLEKLIEIKDNFIAEQNKIINMRLVIVKKRLKYELRKKRKKLINIINF